MQAIYWLCTFITIILLAISFKPGKVMMSKFAFVVLTFRNIIRLFNFELTEGDGVILIQQVMCAILLIGLHNNLETTSVNVNIERVLVLIFTITISKQNGFLKYESILDITLFILLTFLINLIGYTVCIFTSSANKSLLKQTKLSHDLKDELNQILENLEE
jgi:hypothetical protein